VLWPVIHQWLGVSPDLGRGRVAVVPQLPTGQPKASANSVKLGALTSTWLLSTKARLDDYSDQAWPGGFAHRDGASGWGHDRIGHIQRFAGQAEAGEDHPWAGSDRLGQSRTTYGAALESA